MSVAVGGSASIGQKLAKWTRRGAEAKLSSPSFELRRAALAARERELEDECRQRLEALERQKREAQARLAAETAAARARVDEWEDRRSRELAANALAALCKLAAKFPDAPRSTAEAVAKVWRELAETVRTELGEEVNWRLLAAAFLPPDAFGALGNRSFDEGSDAPAVRAGALSKAIVDGLPPAVIEDRVRALEMASAERAKLAPNEERARVLTSHASARRTAMAHEEYLRNEENERRVRDAELAEKAAEKLRGGWIYVARGRNDDDARVERERDQALLAARQREIDLVYGANEGAE
mgnify:CR=1 FL=1